MRASPSNYDPLLDPNQEELTYSSHPLSDEYYYTHINNNNNSSSSSNEFPSHAPTDNDDEMKHLLDKQDPYTYIYIKKQFDRKTWLTSTIITFSILIAGIICFAYFGIIAVPEYNPVSSVSNDVTVSIPTLFPSNTPTREPTLAVPTLYPSRVPTKQPSDAPTTKTPTKAPSVQPTDAPTTMTPTLSPTARPTDPPIREPTYSPTPQPIEDP